MVNRILLIKQVAYTGWTFPSPSERSSTMFVIWPRNASPRKNFPIALVQYPKFKHIHVHTSSRPRMFQMLMMSVWMAFAQVIILWLEKPTPDVIAVQYSSQNAWINKPARIVRIWMTNASSQLWRIQGDVNLNFFRIRSLNLIEALILVGTSIRWALANATSVCKVLDSSSISVEPDWTSSSLGGSMLREARFNHRSLSLVNGDVADGRPGYPICSLVIWTSFCKVSGIPSANKKSLNDISRHKENTHVLRKHSLSVLWCTSWIFVRSASWSHDALSSDTFVET